VHLASTGSSFTGGDFVFSDAADAAAPPAGWESELGGAENVGPTDARRKSSEG